MKKFLVFAFALAVMSCNDKKDEGTTAEAKASVPANMYGFTPAYSASFVMAPAANSETVLALWSDWKGGDLSKSRGHFADSISLFMADGSMMVGPADTILKGVQAYRSTYKSIDVAVDAIFAIKSTDKDENWVAAWGTEIQTSMEGKIDTVSVQETWRFNKAGKVDMMMQAMRKGMLPPPPAN